MRGQLKYQWIELVQYGHPIKYLLAAVATNNQKAELPTLQTNRMLQQIFITLLLIFHLASSTQEKSTDMNVEEVKDEFNGHFSDPSAKAAMIKHIGDMAFIDVPHKNQSTDKRARRNAIRYTSALWPNARVPYTISSGFSENERDVILKAMRHWEDKTCLRFFPRTTEPYYIYILSGDGCYSYVGRLYRNYQPQGLSLGPGCVYLRIAVHEIGHAVGFYHEHTRHDRDQYISVISNNIRDGQAGNFAKFRTGQTNTFGYGYDYASIMHYSGASFAKSRSNPTIVAKDEGIVFGSAQELSPLDILKANALYRCGSRRPPISTYPQSTKPLTLPDGITCGGVMESKSGTFFSPSYPKHILNQRCAWVIRVPEGYRVRLSFPGLTLEQSTGCNKDYVQVFSGRSLDPKDGEYLSRNARNGKFCSSSQISSSNYVYDNTATVYYYTDSSNTGSGTPRGLRVDFSTIDINECGGRSNRCHTCTNFDGSYRCECKNGYYHSPAANTCWDFNECAYENGGCDHICDNTGGSYICKCNPGYYLQADGLSCRTTPPAPPTVAPPTCGGALTSAIGALLTPNWPESYPFNFDCEWTISLPNSNQIVELTFNTVFGIAGKTIENCPKDYLKIYSGRALTHTICDLELPSPIRTTSNNVRLVFHAGSDQSPLRKGFRITYRAINRPTIAPPTTPTTVPPPTTRTTTMSTTTPTTQPPTPANICGPSLFTGASGSFQTPAWPETYPLNFDCEWNIQVPSPGCNVRLTFDELAFGIAGKTTENCPKDYLKIHDNNGLIHTICDLGRPSLITTTGNTTLYFYAGPYHGPKRTGFRIDYTTVCPTTTPPPTTRPTTVATTTPDPTTPPPTTRPTTVATTTPDPTTPPPTTRPTTVATTTPDPTTPPPTTRPTTVATTTPTLVPTTMEVTTLPLTPAPTTLPPTPNCPVLITSPQNSVFTCGGFMRPGDSFGPANLPSGPISKKMSCSWYIFSSGVRFKYFDIPNSEECSSNSVAVYDGYGTGGPLIEKMCGEKCDEYIVEGTKNILTVVLEVFSPGSFKGFYAQ